MLRLILRSLIFHWRVNLAIALGVMAGTAVLTGALVVGDSVRGSLAHLTLDRLGSIDHVLVTDRFFRRELTEELTGQAEFKRHFSAALPAVLVQGTLENPVPEHRARAGRVMVLGCEEQFWKLGSGRPARLPGKDDVVLNRPLA